ncbi:hypothetical protein GCM10007209_31860 [Haloferax sulfurifontis]|uniref:Uncharacterized protein n=1 Tax=Haloferax sulfurifontis TaxID=255616 RepID=A0A830E980_9EURY|nr:hypothetical protein GCM10007209_31860 [Haloferax sulfurifontis]
MIQNSLSEGYWLSERKPAGGFVMGPIPTDDAGFYGESERPASPAVALSVSVSLDSSSVRSAKNVR